MVPILFVVVTHFNLFSSSRPLGHVRAIEAARDRRGACPRHLAPRNGRLQGRPRAVSVSWVLIGLWISIHDIGTLDESRAFQTPNEFH